MQPLFFFPVAPATHKARQSDHAPEPLISSPKSPSNKEYHSPALSPSASSYKHHPTRNTTTSPGPASSYMVSPPTSKHQGLLSSWYIKLCHGWSFCCYWIYVTVFILCIWYRSSNSSFITTSKWTKTSCSTTNEPRYYISIINLLDVYSMRIRSKQRSFLIAWSSGMVSSSVPLLSSPIHSPMSKVSSAPSPSIEIAPHPTESKKRWVHPFFCCRNSILNVFKII